MEMIFPPPFNKAYLAAFYAKYLLTCGENTEIEDKFSALKKFLILCDRIVICKIPLRPCFLLLDT